MLEVTRRSAVSGKVRTIEMPITIEQMTQYMFLGYPIQVAFPNLSPAQREFIMTGISDDEWQDIFSEEEDESEEDE